MSIKSRKCTRSKKGFSTICNILQLPFGRTKLGFLKQYLPFKYSTPSDDTLRRFFRALDPEKFETCFIQWVRSFQINLENKIVAIDGKTSRHSFDGDISAIHIISAFASEIGIVLGQLKVDSKSNEINNSCSLFVCEEVILRQHVLFISQ